MHGYGGVCHGERVPWGLCLHSVVGTHSAGLEFRVLLSAFLLLRTLAWLVPCAAYSLLGYLTTGIHAFLCISFGLVKNLLALSDCH